MRRLLCRLLGHRRWERDGRYPKVRKGRYWWWTVAGENLLIAATDGLMSGAMRWGPTGRLEAQQFLTFTRSWRCWRCRHWFSEPGDPTFHVSRPSRLIAP